MMFSSNLSRKVPIRAVKKISSLTANYGSKIIPDEPKEVQFHDQQATYYTAKDVEFCPNRAREVMQNYVVQTSHQDMCNDDPFVEGQKVSPATPMSDRDHMEAYQSGSSVSLHSVMQSNVPEPFNTSGKAPTHLNMPGSSSSQEYKYLSGRMQNTHQSKQ